MREERGQLKGNLDVKEPYTLLGSVGGDVTVRDGGKFYHRGSIYGNLIVEYGGRVHIFGNVKGTVTVKKGAKVIHSGAIGGDAVNLGGRLYIEPTATVMGKVKTKDGDTVEYQERKIEESGWKRKELD
jgi:cytoskeletal protein CcmA (bactofilin family)